MKIKDVKNKRYKHYIVLNLIIILYNIKKLMPSIEYLTAINTLLKDRTNFYKGKIIIRGINDNDVKQVAIWIPDVGVKLRV